MAEALPQSHDLKTAEAVIDLVVVGVDHIHEGLEVGGGPPALEIGVGESEVALADQAGEGVGVVDDDLGHRTGIGGVDAEQAAVRHAEVEAAISELSGEAEGGCEIARQIPLAVQRRDRIHLLSPGVVPLNLAERTSSSTFS